MNKNVTTEVTQTCLELAVELTHGPRFFDDRGNPTDSLERYTGSRVTQDAERCLMAGALRLLECSDRQIADALRCDVRSIPLMLRQAEKTGRIPALKDRLAQITGTNAERSQLALASLLNRAADGGCSVDLAAMIKAVATTGGIATQNLQLLTGGPTEILELRVGAGREEIERWARELAIPVDAQVVPTPGRSPTDLESAETAQNPQQSGPCEPTGHDRDTSATGPAATDAGRRRTQNGGVAGVSAEGGPGDTDRSIAS